MLVCKLAQSGNFIFHNVSSVEKMLLDGSLMVFPALVEIHKQKGKRSMICLASGAFRLRVSVQPAVLVPQCARIFALQDARFLNHFGSFHSDLLVIEIV
jgi:hypothetical protein